MEEKDYGYLGGDAREWNNRAPSADVQQFAEIYLLEQKHQREVERLQEEHHDVRILNEQYYNENAILLDEIERLREALRHIADYEGGPVDLIWKEMRDIANKALQQKESE